MEPDNALAYDLLGLAYGEMESFELAEKFLSMPSSWIPLWRQPFTTWYYRQQQLRYQEALTLFDRAIGMDAYLEIAYFNRALVHKAMGNVDAAIEDYDHLLGASGEGRYKYGSIGESPENVGDIMGARRILNVAMRLAHEDNAVLYSCVVIYSCCWGNYLAAEQDYTGLLNGTGFAEVFYNRGVARMLAYNHRTPAWIFRKVPIWVTTGSGTTAVSVLLLNRYTMLEQKN